MEYITVGIFKWHFIINGTQSFNSSLEGLFFLFFYFFTLCAPSRWLPFPLSDGDRPHHSSPLVFLACFILSDLKEQRGILQLSAAQTHSPAAIPPGTCTPLRMRDAVNPCVCMMARPSWEQNIKCQYGVERQAGLFPGWQLPNHTCVRLCVAEWGQLCIISYLNDWMINDILIRKKK